jgi:hypothetical protein
MRQKDEQPTLTQTNTEENLETVYHEPFVDYIKGWKKNLNSYCSNFALIL